MIVFLITAIKIIFLLGFLVLIHEGGHFLVAKLCKVRVNEFAIGWGPTLVKWQGKETKYALRLFPIGGFVSMEGEEERSDKEGSFSKASIPKRIAIVLAGGFVNIAFGLLVYFVLVSSQGGHQTTVINNVIPDYAAEQAGLQEGDKILKIDGKSIKNEYDYIDAMSKLDGNQISVLVDRNNEQKEILVKPSEISYKSTGIYFGAEGEEITTEIVALYPGSPAEKAGIQIGDIITKVNGEDINKNPYKVAEKIENLQTEEVTFTIDRDGKVIEIIVKPDTIKEYKLGIQFKEAENNFFNNVYYGFWDTKEFAVSIIDNLKMLFSGKVSTNQLMGPIGISEVVAKTDGVRDFISMLALISLSLGVTNLLPFPPLDGGRVVFLLLEAIRRKPLEQKTELSIQMAGFMILIGLSIYIAYNDILRIF